MALALGVTIPGSAFASRQARGPGVQDIAALKAIPSGERFDKMLTFVEDELIDYHFDAQSAAAESLPDIVAPTSGTGRWFRASTSGGLPASHALAGAEHTGSTLAALNGKVTDAVLVDTGDARFSDDRDPNAHAAEHTDSTDDIQNATAAQKGLATAAQITKLDGVAVGADVTGDNPPQAHTHTHAAATGQTADDHHAQSHAGDHSDGGSDEIVAENLASAGAANEAVMGDGSGGLKTELVVRHSDIGDPGNAGRVKRTGGTLFGTIKDATGESVDPIVTDDSAAGYEVGSIWLNTTANRAFKLIDASVGAAIWLVIGRVSQLFGRWIPAGIQGPWHTSLGGPDNNTGGGWGQTRFHDSADEEISTVLRLLEGIDLSVNPTMTLYFAPDELQGGARVARLTNGSEYAGVGEVFPAATEGVDSSMATPTLAKELFSVVDTLTASLMTAGDLVEYHVGRAATHVDDTLVGHLSFFGALFLCQKLK